MILLFILLFLACGIFILALIHGSDNTYDRNISDKEQRDYLDKWNNRHNKL